MNSTILVPTDFSADAEAALRYAGLLAHALATSIHILTVKPSSLLPHTEDESDSVEPLIHKQLEAAAVADANITCVRSFLRGNPPDEILKFCEQHPTELIVMGTHGQTNSSDAAMGSIAQAVVRRAKCPVLTVKMPASRR